ncbi:nitroreductase family protein [Listeria costaricensis]|uniref:nitroreductase family protein n=1 Tax=Listeria costaricensis TaxID=2026604 RepID=UPI000C06F8BD|nr:nitroreductase family protein [Listeria costaricensis]
MKIPIEHPVLKRRSVKKISSEPLDKKVVMELLEAAGSAPFHSKVEPWHVYTIETDAQKNRYFQAVVEGFAAKADAPLTEAKKADLATSQQKKVGESPLILIVTSTITGDEKKDFEAICAVSAFIQNFQILAFEKEIGTLWRSGKFIFEQAFQEKLGIPADEKVMGVFALTRVTELPAAKSRRSASEWIKEI